MSVKAFLFGTILAACVFTGACSGYRADRKAEARDQMEALEEANTRGPLAGKIRLPKPKERIETIPAISPTPTPRGDDLLNRPLDPAGAPNR